MSLERDLQLRLAGVRIKYKDRLIGYEREIIQLTQDACDPERQRASVSGLCQVVHKMRGPAKMLGFENVGICAEICEADLEQFLSNMPHANAGVMSITSLKALMNELSVTNQQI